jgi:REP element-mobilizing transposase RayT
MTQPRLVVPGDTLMITRRTLRRHHLFRPDPAIRQLYLYTLALCARQFGILVHAVTLMSTHEHLIVTDPQGRYPDFLRRLHRLVSLGTKVLRKWEGPTWDHESSSVVRLLTEQAVIEQLAYVMANPVKAGLVRHARDWPGITVLPHELGRRTWTLRRPDVYFNRENRQWSDTIELSLTLPRTSSIATPPMPCAKPSKRSSSARSAVPTPRSKSGVGASSARTASVAFPPIGVPRASSRSEIETRASPWAAGRRGCSLRRLPSFARFVGPTDTPLHIGARD